MQGLNRAVAAGFTFEFREESYTLRPPTLGDLGDLEQHLLRLKKERHLRRVTTLEGLVDEATYKAKLDEAVNEAIEFDALTDVEIDELLNSSEGSLCLFDAILNKQIPGVFNRSDIKSLILDGVIKDTDIAELFNKLNDTTVKMINDPLDQETGPGESEPQK